MSAILLILIVVLLILYLYERGKNKRKSKEISYIREWLQETPYLKEERQILIPSDNLEIRELATGVNRLLELFYLQKAEYDRSKRAMEQVLTNIAHDLRTPLTVLKGYSELLCRELSDKEEMGRIPEMVLKVDGKANELVSTINDYFTMSKIISGDMKMEMRSVNITQICHDVILEYYDILEEAQYNVEMEISAVPEYACADLEALKRILKNLIDNAIKHGSDGKYLALRVEKKSDGVMIGIEDHGKGISERRQEQIFSRNYTTAQKSSGSGLGLTIARNLAQQMGADIQVYSEPGVKTVFTVILKS